LQSPDQCLKSILEQCTNRSCSCIALAQTLNDERELLSSSNDDRATIDARRKQREDDRLPSVLKASSEYWVLKKRAAKALRKRELDHSTNLYLEAITTLEQHMKPMHQYAHEWEWAIKIGKEQGKIASNLSMIYLMRDRKEDAFRYAEQAVKRYPDWSKSYCRLALSLKSLGKFQEARVAIINAIERGQRDNSKAKGQRKSLKTIKKSKKK